MQKHLSLLADVHGCMTRFDPLTPRIVAAQSEDGLTYEELQTVLAECGYVQLYWRNPFDWMIGYCAMSLNPLDTLRDLIEEYYLSDPTVQNQ